MVPDKSIERAMNEDLQKYVEYTGAEFTVYDGDELNSMKKSSLPDILFINHRYCNRGDEIEQYLKLDTKTVVVTTGVLKGKIEKIEDQIDRVFYKPINFSKTLKSLEILKESSAESKVVQAEQNESNERFKHIHALVAEDNTINQKLIKNVLNGFGVEVTLANNGEVALDLRTQNEYDIIFMDIQMPVLGGIEATQKILEFEEKHRKHHIPIVALTANALEGDREKYINAGMDNYISKPIELVQLNLLMQEYFPHKIVEAKEEVIENDIETKEIENTVETDIEKENNIVVEVEKNDEEIHDDTLEALESINVIGENIQVESIDMESIDNSIVESQESEVKVENMVEKDLEVKRKSDILVYHSLPLIANLYRQMLKNLEYDVDMTTDNQKFLDKLDDTDYKFVIYDIEPFRNMKCMIADIIHDNRAKPIGLVHNPSQEDDFCCDILEEKANIENLKKKLEIDLV